MMNPVFRKIDPASEEELLQFCELMDQLTSRAADLDLLRRNIARANEDEERYLLAAFDPATGRMCGSLLCVLFDDFCEACQPLMIIENVVTHRDFRGQGVGKAMLCEAEKWGAAHHVNYINLTSSEHRKGAHMFYERAGYEHVKGFRKYL